MLKCSATTYVFINSSTALGASYIVKPNSLFGLVAFRFFSNMIKRYFALTFTKLNVYFDISIRFFWESSTTVSR